ncbi:MAG: hypothetical protein NT154_23895 [Verrucomicrobia bacterium]|nr:hypothetical protein [Verrucomicrobiota bacterium]
MSTSNDESPAARLARAEEEDRLDAAWLEQALALAKAAQERGLVWFEALAAVQPSLPPRPPGYELRKQICNRCGQPIEMNWDFDALLCRCCNRWIESTCSQPDCGFCSRRPLGQAGGHSQCARS